MKKILTKFVVILTLSIISAGFILPAYCLAEPPEKLKEYTFNINQITVGDSKYLKEGNPIVNLILNVINFAIKIIGTIAVITMIASGFMFMFARGNQEKLTTAKDIFKYTIFALAIVFLSYLIVIFVQSLFITTETVT